jgi:hypothetical protein
MSKLFGVMAWAGVKGAAQALAVSDVAQASARAVLHNDRSHFTETVKGLQEKKGRMADAQRETLQALALALETARAGGAPLIALPPLPTGVTPEALQATGKKPQALADALAPWGLAVGEAWAVSTLDVVTRLGAVDACKKANSSAQEAAATAAAGLVALAALQARETWAALPSQEEAAKLIKGHAQTATAQAATAQACKVQAEACKTGADATAQAEACKTAAQAAAQAVEALTAELAALDTATAPTVDTSTIRDAEGNPAPMGGPSVSDLLAELQALGDALKAAQAAQAMAEEGKAQAEARAQAAEAAQAVAELKAEEAAQALARTVAEAAKKGARVKGSKAQAQAAQEAQEAATA